MRLSAAAVLCSLALLGAGLAAPERGAERRTPAPPEAGRAAHQGAVEAVPRTDFRNLRLAGPFPAAVGAVIDGDTFEARVTIWLGHEVTTRVRILGIDAAEMSSDCAEERELAAVSRAALERLLAGGGVTLSDVRFDKYGGRVLARVRAARTNDVAAEMLHGGYAIAYEGGRREPWCGVSVVTRR